MQVIHTFVKGHERQLVLPPAHEAVLPNVIWGKVEEPFTPAFWRMQFWHYSYTGQFNNYKLGRTLREEVAACLLGGFGMPAELGLAAFARMKILGLLEYKTPLKEIEAALVEPFLINNKSRKYRFAHQKAKHLHGCLMALNAFCEPEDDQELRRGLMELPGIGPKTASWIVRNYRGSDSVAIIDVHILRACRIAKVFTPDMTPDKCYFELENQFLHFSEAIGARSSVLDNLIWHQMRRFGYLFNSPNGLN